MTCSRIPQASYSYHLFCISGFWLYTWSKKRDDVRVTIFLDFTPHSILWRCRDAHGDSLVSTVVGRLQPLRANSRAIVRSWTVQLNLVMVEPCVDVTRSQLIRHQWYTERRNERIDDKSDSTCVCATFLWKQILIVSGIRSRIDDRPYSNQYIANLRYNLQVGKK